MNIRLSPKPAAKMISQNGKVAPANGGNGEIDKWEVVKAPKPLTDKQRLLLAEKEKIIRENLGEFVAVGLALKEIRDKKLYRETSATFEEYCLSNFDFGKAYGHRLIGAATAMEELKKSPIGDGFLPKTESQMRVLLRVPEKKRVAVLKLAGKNAGKLPLNALLIQEAALEITPAPPEAKRSSFYTPASYTTDLKIFVDWLESLKSLTLRGEKKELVRLLEKAITEKAILPEMPEMVLIREVNAVNGWMGNMSAHKVKHEKQIYRTTEALFQVLRFDGHTEIQKRLLLEQSPMGVKMIAKKHRRLLENPDSEVDLEIMRLCLKLKIEQHADLKKLLLATGDKMIVEDCSARPRGDSFYWGLANINGQWVGANWLGRLWMELREKLQRKQ